jgi:glycosyltransferase involved in cell wall biosynthesis
MLNKEEGANISFLGSVKDMYKLLASCHILVYPSKSAAEGFPAVITEAGANGVLVVTSGFKGVEYVIQNNSEGLIFMTGDVNNLVKILSNAVNRYEKYSALTHNFYRKIKEQYSIDGMIEKHMELYRKCL